MLMLIVLNAGALLAALILARAVGRARPSLTILCGLCAYLLIVHSVLLAAGLVGWLTPRALAGGVVGALLIVLGLARRLPPDAAFADRRPRMTVPGFAASVVAMGTAVAWARPHLFEATRLWIWDDYTYHMVYPALWLREHAISAVTPSQAFTMQSWYPLSADLVATWFMAPFADSRGDALAWTSLTGVLYAAIVASAAAELLGRVGCRRGAWAVPTMSFVTSERIGILASSFSDADLAHAASLFAAFAFAVPRGDDERARDVRVDACFAALLAGFAIGVKVSAVPAALLVAVMLGLRAGVGVSAVVALAWIVTGGYWYLRNLAHTGNPFYPAGVLWWSGTTFPFTTLREYGHHHGFPKALRDALHVYMNWPVFHALLAVAGLVGLTVWLAVRWRARTRAQSFLAFGALGITVITLLLLPSMPYSAGVGMTFVSGFVHWDSMRYVALLPLLGWVSLGFLLDAGTAAPRTGPAPSRLALSSAVAASIVVGAIVVASHGAKAAATAGAIYREPLFGAAAAVLDREPAGTRLAVYGDQWIYPAFGARHDLTPVRLDPDGRVAVTPIGDAMTPGPLTVDPRMFGQNLRQAAIRIVVVVHMPHPGRSPEWPSQARALDALEGAGVLYRDGAVGIWTLNR